MNLRKNLGRVASTIVATALLASVATVPAFAAYDQGASYENKLKFNQYLTLDANAKAPTITNIDYTITGVADPAANEDGMPITGGIDAEKIALTYDGFAPTDDVNTDNDGSVVGSGLSYVTDEISVDISAVSYTVPGIYRYSITPVWETETQPVNGVTLDNATHYLDVYVIDENGTLKVSNAILHMTNAVADNEGTLSEAKSASFKHTYNTEDLTLKKVVSGTLGDKSKDFTFTIKINPEDTTSAKQFTVSYGSNQTKTITSGGTGAEITLKHGESATIYGLSAADKYVIAETDYSKEGYTTEYTIDVNEAAEAPESATKAVTTNNQDMGESGHSVIFYNDKDATTPTGIVMNVAPYALLVVVAVAGCFVFLRKRNED